MHGTTAFRMLCVGTSTVDDNMSTAVPISEARAVIIDRVGNHTWAPWASRSRIAIDGWGCQAVALGCCKVPERAP